MPAAGLIGREAELAVLTEALGQLERGEGGLVLVVGDAGIGKTALVEAVTSAAADRGIGAYWGRCWEGGGGAVFWPWVQVLRAALADIPEREAVDLLAAAGTELRALLPDLAPHISAPPSVSSSGLDARFRLFDAIGVVLAGISHRCGGLVVALDDLHDADVTSLQVLRYLTRTVGRSPLLLVGSYREADVATSPERRVLLDAAARMGQTVTLHGLDTRGVGALLGRMGLTDPSVVQPVHAATDGNPFLVLESSRLVLGGGDPSRLLLVPGAHAIVERRLGSLPPETHRHLRLAALLGREFELATLSRLSVSPPDELLDGLASAVAARVVGAIGVGRWSFHHALLREVLLDEIDDAERPPLHRAAAAALTWRHGDDPAVAGQVASHLAAAAQPGDTGGAVEACTRAAEVAMKRFAYEEAAAWCERALDVLALSAAVDERRRYDLLVQLGEARLRQGDPDLAKDAFARSFRAARALGSVERLAEAAVRIAPLAVSDPVVISALDDALCDLPEGDGALRARAMVSFARVMSSSNIQRQALAQVNREAVAMARRVGEADVVWDVLWLWHQNAFRQLGSLEERIAVADELLARALDANDEERIVQARTWRAANLFERGDAVEATAEAEMARREAETLRQPLLIANVLSVQMRLALLEGRFGDAEALASRARLVRGVVEDEAAPGPGPPQSLADIYAAATSRGPTPHIAHTDAQWEFQIQLWGLGRSPDDFERLIADARESLRRWPVYGMECLRQIGIAFAMAELGRQEEASKELRAQLSQSSSKWVTGNWVVEKLFGHPTPYGWIDAPRLCCAAAVAEVCWSTADNEWALTLYDLLVPYADHHVIVGQGDSRGSCARYVGQLAALMGRFDEADAHFRAAHLFHQRIGARVWGARGLADHARMLLMRRGEGDPTRAGELLALAVEEFRAMGLTVYADRAEADVAAIATDLEEPRVTHEGEFWSFTYGGKVARIPDTVGARYLARLLRTPGQEQHALDLVVGVGGGSGRVAGDAGAVLDEAARAAYHARLELLEAQMEVAAEDERGRIQAEMDALARELSGGIGLGGRGRRAASDAERARQSVTRVVKRAIERLAVEHPALGDHLRACVRTGLYSSYRPEHGSRR